MGIRTSIQTINDTNFKLTQKIYRGKNHSSLYKSTLPQYKNQTILGLQKKTAIINKTMRINSKNIN